MLIDFFENRNGMMTEFEEEAFAFIVERMTAVSETEIEFCIMGGLKFTEHYPQNQD